MSVDQENPQNKKSIMSVLDQLKAVTTIVADTGDFEGKLASAGNVMSYDVINNLS